MERQLKRDDDENFADMEVKEKVPAHRQETILAKWD